MSLAEALQNVELESGRTYQVEVGDKIVQVKVVSKAQLPLAMAVEGDEAPFTTSPDLSPTAPTTILRATRTISGYDRPFVITEDDLKAGDLD
jgi:hypothetical protein